MPHVKLFANLRTLAGTKELSIRGSTVGAVLNDLVKQNPALGEILLENGGLRPHIIITLNGNNMDDMDVEVNEQDIIAVFPPIAGG